MRPKRIQGKRIEAQCRGCDRTISVPFVHAGGLIRCARCDRRVRVAAAYESADDAECDRSSSEADRASFAALAEARRAGRGRRRPKLPSLDPGARPRPAVNRDALWQGVAMMLGAVACVVVGLGLGRLLVYAPILFVLGVGRVATGMTGERSY